MKTVKQDKAIIADITAMAQTFIRGDMPSPASYLAMCFPMTGRLRSLRCRDGELLMKSHEASNTRGVVGSPGTTTPAKASRVQTMPHPA